MEQIIDFIENLKSVQIIDVVIAVCIIVLFMSLSSSISYMIVRIFKVKHSKKQITESAFYKPLKTFFRILGIYLALVFLQKPLHFSQELSIFIKKVFEIISVLAFARGIEASFTLKSTIVKRYKNKTDKSVNEHMLNFSLRIVRIIIYVIAVFIVFAILEINLGGLVAGLGIGGVIVTLAAQDTAKNIFGGIVIFLDRTFNVGDWIQTPNYEGIVEGITFRTTRIRNFENSVINIPNSIMADSAIINWSKMEKRRYKLKLPFPFEITSEKMKMVTDKIREMLEKDEEVINEDILINFDTISKEGLSLQIDMFVKPTSYDDYIRIKNKINSKILDIVHETGIKLAYPATTVFIGNEDVR